MSRYDICQRIVANIQSMKSELDALENDRRNLELRLQRRQDELDRIFDDALEPGLPIGRAPKRPGRVGTGLDIIGALGQVLNDDSPRVIRELQSEIGAFMHELERVEEQIRRKSELIRNQQGEFNRYGCFNLGFSHEVLNAP